MDEMTSVSLFHVIYPEGKGFLDAGFLKWNGQHLSRNRVSVINMFLREPFFVDELNEMNVSWLYIQVSFSEMQIRVGVQCWRRKNPLFMCFRLYVIICGINTHR